MKNKLGLFILLATSLLSFSCEKILSNLLIDTISNLGSSSNVFDQISSKKDTETNYDINLKNVVVNEVSGNNDGLLNQNEKAELSFVFNLKKLVSSKTTVVESIKTNDTKEAFRMKANIEEKKVDSLRIKIVNNSSLVEFESADFYTSNLSKIESPKIYLKVSNTGQTLKRAPISIIITDNNGDITTIKAELLIPAISNSFSIDDWNIDDYYGNNDGIANRGEKIRIYPVLRNSGKSNTNNITATIRFTDNNLVEFSQIEKTYNYNKIKSFSESIKIEEEPIDINISKNIQPNSILPVKIDIKDDFGNIWSESSNLKIEKIANDISVKTIAYLDENGNQDFLPNKGERVKLKVVLENTGTSPTNDLKVEIKSKQKFLDISKPELFVERFAKKYDSKLSEDSIIFQLDPNVAIGDNYPISMKIYDDFNNSWNDLRLITVFPVAYQLSITKMDIEEINSTNNKKRFKITPYFRNIGLSSSNSVFLSAINSNEDSEIIEARKSISVEGIKKGEIKKSSDSFIIQINTDKKFNLNIPVLFYLEDKFGNKNQILYNVIIP